VLAQKIKAEFWSGKNLSFPSVVYFGASFERLRATTLFPDQVMQCTSPYGRRVRYNCSIFFNTVHNKMSK